MTFQRKLFADAPRENWGFDASPTGDPEKAGVLEVRGGHAFRSLPAHVENREHRIEHLLETTTDLNTLRYKENDGAIDPALASRWMLRASGDLTISLEKTPAVPGDQIHPLGVARQREADVEVVIYSAAAVNITWPSGVLWGRAGYELTGDPATLNELPGPPANPRPAGTADRFMLRYNERTGEWWATVTHTAVAAADPSTQPPDTTVPEPPEDDDGGEDGLDSDQTPDNDYTDPETGDTLTPEAIPPTTSEAVVYALHGAAISRSLDGGATWTRWTAPSAPYAFSALPGSVAIATISGELRYAASNALGNGWLNVPLTVDYSLEIPVPNGGFETGALAPWTLHAGTAPVLRDGAFPPQEEGSFNVGADPMAASPDFEIGQVLTVPPEANAGVEVTVRAFVGDPVLGASSATLEVATQKRVASLNTGLSYSGTIIQGFATSPEGYALNLEIESGGMDGFTGDGAGNTKTIAIKYASDGSLYEGPWALPLTDFDPVESVQVWAAVVESVVIPDGQDISVTEASTLTITAGVDDQDAAIIFRAGRVQVTFNLNNSRIGILPTVEIADAVEAQEAPSIPVRSDTTTDTDGQWQTLRVELGKVEGGLDVRLIGTGPSVYFDNVKVSASGFETNNVSTVAQDRIFARHVAFTTEGAFDVRDGGYTYLGPTPFRAFYAAASGEGLLIAGNAGQIASSMDSGSTWRTATLPDVNGVYRSRGDFLATTTDGKVHRLDLTTGAVSELHAGDAGASLARDRFRTQWMGTKDGPGVYQTRDFSTFTDLPALPQSATAGNGAGDRGILPLDIGRVLSTSGTGRDLLWYDEGHGSWRVGFPLGEGILDLQEAT